MLATPTALTALPVQERPHLVHVMDREGDILTVLAQVAAQGNTAVIRCYQNRKVEGEPGLAHAALQATPVLGQTTMTVQASDKQPGRKAKLALRSVALILESRVQEAGNGEPVTYHLVEAKEIDYPNTVTEPLHWLLWTLEPAPTLAEVERVLEIYRLQPRLEDFQIPGPGVEQWCPVSGQVRCYHCATTDAGTEARFRLPPCGSLLLFLSNQPGPLAPESRSGVVQIDPLTQPTLHRLDDNLLVLNYLDLTTRGETKKSIHCRQATNDLFACHGFPGNPWFESMQFADEHIRRRFPSESSFEVRYRFAVAERIPGRLPLVLERPDLYQSITCNGVALRPIPKAWWLDRSFGRIDLGETVRVGENIVTIQAQPFTVFHELEPAYVLGSFNLRPDKRGFVIVPEVPLRVEAGAGWNTQGHPFYSGGVAYMEQFEVPRLEGRYRVELGSWLGSVAKVIVNGKPAGTIAWQPWECDVTEMIRPGRNTIEIIVLGTLRNTLGPHHAGSPQGIVTPHMFNQAPTSGPPPGPAIQYDRLRTVRPVRPDEPEVSH